MYVWCWFKFDSILINSLFFWYTAHLFWKPYNYLGNREIHIKIMFYRVQSKTQGIPVMIVGNCLAVYKYFVFFCTMVMGNSNIKILSSIWTLYESFEYIQNSIILVEKFFIVQAIYYSMHSLSIWGSVMGNFFCLWKMRK